MILQLEGHVAGQRRRRLPAFIPGTAHEIALQLVARKVTASLQVGAIEAPETDEERLSRGRPSG